MNEDTVTGSLIVAETKTFPIAMAVQFNCRVHELNYSGVGALIYYTTWMHAGVITLLELRDKDHSRYEIQVAFANDEARSRWKNWMNTRQHAEFTVF